MRVLMVHDFAGLLGGANRYRSELTRRLTELGHEVNLFTFLCDPPEAGVRVFPYSGDGPLAGRLKQNVFHPGLYAALRSHIRSFSPDVIHVQGNHLYTHTVHLACVGGAPLVQTVHDVRLVCPNERGVRRNGQDCSWSFGTVCVREGCVPARTIISRWFSKTVTRLLFNGMNWRMIAPSRALCENIRHFGVSPVFIPNFAPPLDGSAPSRPSDSTSIAFVGALYPSKGVGHLLHSFGIVSREVPSATLEVIGDGPEMGMLVKTAADLAVTDRVVFHGRTGEEETRHILDSARMLVLPSVVRENCPLVILEAMALAKPVVASLVGGVPELVENGRNGLLVPYGCEEELAEAMISLLRDDRAADRMGEEGRDDVRKKYTAGRHMDGILDLYGEVTGIRRKAQAD